MFKSCEIRNQMEFCLSQFKAMGATKEQLRIECYKLTYQEYLTDWLGVLGYVGYDHGNLLQA